MSTREGYLRCCRCESVYRDPTKLKAGDVSVCVDRAECDRVLRERLDNAASLEMDRILRRSREPDWATKWICGPACDSRGTTPGPCSCRPQLANGSGP